MSVTIQVLDMKFKLTGEDSIYTWTSIPSKDTRESWIKFNLEFIQSTSNNAHHSNTSREYLEDMELYLAESVVSRLNEIGENNGYSEMAKIIEYIPSKKEPDGGDCLVFSRPK